MLTAGEIDLSIGSPSPSPPWWARSCCRGAVVGGRGGRSLAGAAIGLLNGALVAYRAAALVPRHAPGTMGILAGVGRRLLDLSSVPIDRTNVFIGLFGSGALFGVPSLVLWTIAAVAAGHFALRETPFGAHV